MDTRTYARRVACILAAVVASGTIASAAQARGQSSPETIVKAERPDPEFQRTLSHADLNLAHKSDQKALRGRIRSTAVDLCFDLNGAYFLDCVAPTVASTDDQVSLAIDRARRQMAGLPVGPAIAISIVAGVR